MPDDEPFTPCARCGEKVDPAAEGVQYAVEQKRIEAMRGPQWIDGDVGFFHPECSVFSGWQPRPKP
jgi:hypothetical protein